MNKFLSILFGDFWLKITAVILAVVTWVLVMHETRSQADFNIPLSITSPDHLFITNQSAPEVKVTLTGPAASMNQLRARTLSAHLSIAEKKGDELPKVFDTPQPLTLTITPADILNLPPNIVVKKIRPETTRVEVDLLVSKLLVVKENLSGQVRENLRIHASYPTPRQVMVRGPKSIMDQRTTISTLPIPVDHLEAGKAELFGELDTSDHATKLRNCLSPDRPSVTLWLEVVQKEENRVIKNVPVEVHGLPGFQYIVLAGDKSKELTAIAEVEIKGPAALLDKHNLHAFVDMSDIRNPKEKPEETREVQFSAAPEIQVITKPPTVVVQIKATSEKPAE